MVMRFRCAWYSFSVQNVLFHLLLSKKRHILLGIVHVQIRRSFCLTISSTLVHISFHFKFFLTFFFFPFLCGKSPLYYIHELGLQIKEILFCYFFSVHSFPSIFLFKLKLSPKSSYVSSGRRYIFNKTLMIILHKDYDIEFQRTDSIYVLRMLIFAFMKDFLFFISKFGTLYFNLLAYIVKSAFYYALSSSSSIINFAVKN